MHFPVTYAGFFAPSDNLFFLLLSSLFCPLLKNDGTSVLFFYDALTCVRTLAPIASQARHFPPRSGGADTKKKRIIVFYKRNELIACHSRMTIELKCVL